MNTDLKIKACSCGKPALHVTYWPATKQHTYQCCQCYVEEGNPPADWHSGCMKAYGKLKK